MIDLVGNRKRNSLDRRGVRLLILVFLAPSSGGNEQNQRNSGEELQSVPGSLAYARFPIPLKNHARSPYSNFRCDFFISFLQSDWENITKKNYSAVGHGRVCS